MCLSGMCLAAGVNEGMSLPDAGQQPKLTQALLSTTR